MFVLTRAGAGVGVPGMSATCVASAAAATTAVASVGGRRCQIQRVVRLTRRTSEHNERCADDDDGERADEQGEHDSSPPVQREQRGEFYADGLRLAARSPESSLGRESPGTTRDLLPTAGRCADSLSFVRRVLNRLLGRKSTDGPQPNQADSPELEELDEAKQAADAVAWAAAALEDALSHQAQLARTAQAIASGNLARDVEVSSDDDELGDRQLPRHAGRPAPTRRPGQRRRGRR